LTIPGVGRLTAGVIIGVVGDVRRFPKPESFVAYCGLDPVVERSGKALISKGISKRVISTCVVCFTFWQGGIILGILIC